MAVPTADGKPTGLNYYGKYRHPTHRKPQTEPSWTQRLQELLSEAGYEATKEVTYPGANAARLKRKFCDNVITFPDSTTLWLENKGAWKDYWLRKKQIRKFRSHLLESGNSAVHDIEKLSPLCVPHAHFLGFLLIGFDTVQAPIGAEMDELRDSARLRHPEWHEASIHWADPWREGNQVHAWFWWRKSYAKA